MPLSNLPVQMWFKVPLVSGAFGKFKASQKAHAGICDVSELPDTWFRLENLQVVQWVKLGA